jgi:hypothetical protein
MILMKFAIYAFILLTLGLLTSCQPEAVGEFTEMATGTEYKNAPELPESIDEIVLDGDELHLQLLYTHKKNQLADRCRISQPKNLTITKDCICSQEGCQISVRPQTSTSGKASFTYEISVNGYFSKPSLYSFEVMLKAPVALASFSTLNEDTPGYVALNYIDSYGESAVECQVSALENLQQVGPCSCQTGQCQVQVKGLENFFGKGTFSYTVTTETKTSSPAIAEVTINPVDDAPVAYQLYPLPFNEDTDSIITLNYTDVEFDLATNCNVANLQNLMITRPCLCSLGVCSVQVRGVSDYYGPASFNYSVTSNGLESNVAVASLNIFPVDDAPVAASFTAEAASKNQQLLINLTYTDIEGDLATSCSLQNLKNISITRNCQCLEGVCSVGVTGLQNYFGPAGFSYTVVTNNLTSHPAAVEFTIQGHELLLLSVTPPSGKTYIIGENLDFTLNYNNQAIVDGSPRIKISVGTETRFAVYLSGSATDSHIFRYTVVEGDLAPTGITTVGPGILLSGGSIRDSYGDDASINFIPASFTDIRIDGVKPLISSVIAPSNAIYTPGRHLDFVVNWSEEVIVSGTPRIGVIIGTQSTWANYVAGSGTNSLSFRYTVQNGDQDLDGINVNSSIALNGGSITDLPGNTPASLTYAPINTIGVMVDESVAKIIAITPPTERLYGIGENLDFILNYNFPATVTGTPRIALNIGGQIHYATFTSGNNSASHVFRYTVEEGHSAVQGVATIGQMVDLHGGTIQDQFGDNAELNFASTSYANVRIDGIRPILSSVTPPAASIYLPGMHIDFIFNWSEPVKISGVPRLALTIGGSTRYAHYSAGDESNSITFRYTVVAGDLDEDGIELMNPILLNGGTLSDMAANAPSSLAFILPDLSGVKVDSSASRILSITSPVGARYSTGQVLDFIFTFNGNITITGNPRIQLNIGSQSAYATLIAGGASNNVLTFRYTVNAGHIDTDGIEMVSPILLNSGALKDQYGLDVSRDFTPPDITGILIDGIDLAIAGITPPADNTYGIGDNLDFSVNYNYPASITGSPRIEFTLGAKTAYANYFAGSGSATHIFRYTVLEGDLAPTGIAISSTELDLNGGSVKDSFEDAASSLSYTGGSFVNKRVDGVRPLITSVTSPPVGTYAASDVLDFLVEWSEEINVTGFPRMALVIGTTTKYAVYFSGSGTRTLTFRYVVGNADMDSDGIVVAPEISLYGGTIKDGANNDQGLLSFIAPDTAGIIIGSAASIMAVTPPANNRYGLNDSLYFTLTFDKNVVVTNQPRLRLNIGGLTRYAQYVSGSNTNSLVFRFQINEELLDNDGIELHSPVDLNTTGAIRSLEGHEADLAFMTPDTSNVLIDSRIAVAENSSITGTGPVLANNSETSTITITLKDANNNPAVGVVPTFAATNTDAKNTYGSCSLTNNDGQSTCSLISGRAEVKTLKILTPVAKMGGTVEFLAGAAVAANSTITGTGPVVANGVATSIITVTLRDAQQNPVAGQAPSFIATNTGTTNVYGACSAGNAQGQSFCSLASTRAQVKTLTITAPFSKVGDAVTFVAGAPSVARSSINGTTPVSSDGISVSFIEIILRDEFQNPIEGIYPIFNATDTGSTNRYGACTASGSNGTSSCTLASTVAEFKTLQLTSPIAVTGIINGIEFSNTLPDSSKSSIIGTTNIIANGTSTSTITITLRDFNNNAIPGIEPVFDATNANGGNIYGSCSETTTNGVSTCTLASTRAEIKTLRIISPIVKSDGTVNFIAGPVAATHSTISGTGPTVADDVQNSTITITLKDAHGNPVSGSTPAFTATDTGSTNTLGACSVGNTTGVSTCTLRSRKAETKTLSITGPVSKTGGTVVFIGGPPVATNSSISGTGPISPNGTSNSNITITLRDQHSNLSPGVTPTFSATDSGSNNIYGPCSASNSLGVSSCTLASSTAELKTLSITSPFVKVGGTVEFVLGAPVPENSDFYGIGPVIANGTATSQITIVLRDDTNKPVVGLTPSFMATGSNNHYSQCTQTNALGESSCTLRSTFAELKNLVMTAPFTKIGNSVEFVPGPISVANSSISATSPTLAYGEEPSTITITLKDAFDNPIIGVQPILASTGSLNNLSQCPQTDSSGVAICSMTSTKPEEKVISMTSPISLSASPVDFNPYGIDLEVPIEMLARGVSSTNTGSGRIFSRSRTTLDTDDYEAEENKYFFEIVARNSNNSAAYSVSLINNANSEILSSRITVPSSTTEFTRFRVPWTPNNGSNDYRIRLPKTGAASQLVVSSARIIVVQKEATATKIYIPLAGHSVGGFTNIDNNNASAEIFNTNSQTPTQGAATTASHFYHFTRNDSAYDAYFKTTPWILETITASGTTTATVSLWNRTTGMQVSAAATSGTGDVILRSTSFASNTANFTDGHNYEVRLNSSSSTAVRLMKAGLWIKLKYLRRAEVYRLLALRRGEVSTSTDIDEGRFLWSPENWSNPKVFLQSQAENTSTVVSLRESAADSGTASTLVNGSSINANSTYSAKRSAELSLGNDERYFIRHSATATSHVMGGAFLVIRPEEIIP